ncbi:hypothetical protein [Raoultella sp. C349492]|uniref:hypothetical protein n=1 Tax=Raoultella sp. C349492 TaxID=2970253 RepID=UPI0035C6A5E0
MATKDKSTKPAEVFVKKDDLTGADSAAGDGAVAGSDSAASDGTVAGADSVAGDGAVVGADSAASDGTVAGADSVASDGTVAGADSVAGDSAVASADSAAGDGVVTSADGVVSAWFTVQVTSSPSGQRTRAGIVFSTSPKPFDFSTLSDEQIKKIKSDPFLRIKPYTPAEE